MILQRISKALRQQDWFTVVIETLIVVMSSLVPMLLRGNTYSLKLRLLERLKPIEWSGFDCCLSLLKELCIPTQERGNEKRETKILGVIK
jgi:hypothetical protein